MKEIEWHTIGRPADGSMIILFYKFKTSMGEWRESYEVISNYCFDEEDNNDHLGMAIHENFINIAWCYFEGFDQSLLNKVV